MTPRLCLLLALFAAGPARGGEPAGWINAGVGMAWREPSARPPLPGPLEYDTGTLLHFESASHYRDGLLLRVGYGYTLYDALTAAGVPAIEKDIEQHEARAGAFYAPWPRRGFGWRVGGGYAWHQEDVDSPDAQRTQDGGFVELGARLDAGSRVSFDFAGLGLKVEGRDDYDAEGAELRFAAILRTRPNLTVGLRYLALERESPFDEELYELRVGLGWDWDDLENR